MIVVKSRKDEHSEATRAALVLSAREVFERMPYAKASVDDIVRGARVTKGALYHHFSSKQDIFRTVVAELEQEVAARVVAKTKGEPDPWRRTLAALSAFLELCLDHPAYRRIVLLEAPAALGWEQWRALEEEYALGLISMLVADLVESKCFRAHDREIMARMIFGLTIEAALTIATSKNKTRAHGEVKKILTSMIGALRVT